jgi:uncharacterized cofD-like protein
MQKSMKEFTRWLKPGLGVKRWILVATIGVLLLALGIALLLTHIYRTVGFPGVTGQIAYVTTMQYLERPVRGFLLILAGIIFTGFGVLKFQSTVLEPFLTRRDRLFDTYTAYHRKRVGPKIVTIGGGTGMSLLLRGLKYHTDSITAIVSVADSGGSSGRLRKDLGVLPPGDIRQNIIALSDKESMMAKLFDYRFEGERYGEGLSLHGQNFGNLFLVAMSAITGDFVSAVLESSKILNVHGSVLPSTTVPITLCAELDSGEVIRGEENIDLGKYTDSNQKKINRVFIEPESPPTLSAVTKAIEEADLIVMGPGDLFTSLLPNLLVGEIADAIKRRKDIERVFVCNVANKPTETEGFTVSDYIKTLREHVGLLCSSVIVNTNMKYPPFREGTPYVVFDQETFSEFPAINFIKGDFVNSKKTVNHDPDKVASALLKLYKERNF